MKERDGRRQFGNRVVTLLLGYGFLISGCANSGEQNLSSNRKPVMVPSNQAEGICFLRMSRNSALTLGRDSSATGALVDGRYILTAAHSLYDPPSQKGNLRSIELAVGRADISKVNEETADSFVRRDRGDVGRLPQDLVWSVSPEYQARLTHRKVKKSSGQLVRHDYGFVDPGKDFGRETSFQLSRKSGHLKVGDGVKVAGYPGESKRIKGATGSRLYVGTGRVTLIQGSLFGYDLETSKGVSGGPIWMESGGRRLLVGIHLGSDIGGIQGAVGRLVDQALLNDWDAWVGRRRRR